MLRLSLIILNLFLLVALSGQSKQDYIWLFGYDNQEHASNPVFGGAIVDFNGSSPQISVDLRNIDIGRASASLCDEAGNLLLYTNGRCIANAQHDTIANSNELLTLQESVGNGIGLNLPQGVLLLPLPGSDHEVVLIHEAIRIIPPNPPITVNVDVGGGPIYETRVDLSLNGQAGGVTIKRDTVLNEILDFGKLTAVRHSNGRDWWIVAPGYNSEWMHRLLLDPEGLHALPPQNVGITLRDGLGQAVFSPDGSKYAHMSLHTQVQNYLHILDFDRCTGLFSNPVQIFYPDNDVSGGVAIAPNSRYLYLSSYLQIYQYDLHAENVEATRDTVAVYDGYVEAIPGTDFELPTRFFLAQLAPDGKIYLSTTNTVRSLHVINYPDLPGDACEVVQHGVTLPTLNAFGLPNLPNFRLGALANSGCDTLGPIAAFNYTATGLNLDFEDTSLKVPTTWSWDFGDGEGAEEQNPQHLYALEGIYNVCLTAGNAYGTDTHCQEISVTITSTTDRASWPQEVRLYPNPAKGSAVLENRQNSTDFILYDAMGRSVVQCHQLSAGEKILNLKGLAPGTYWYEVWHLKNRVGVGKFVILPD